MKRIKIIISGQVHGVGFRSFLKKNAPILNLKGYAKNLLNNKVEAIFEGKEEDIKKILDLCKKGPENSVVKKIEFKKEKYKAEFNDFLVY